MYTCKYILLYIHVHTDTFVLCVYVCFWSVCMVQRTGPHLNILYTLHYNIYTGWRRLIGCLKLQVFFRKRTTNYRALLRKMTYEGKASCGSTPPCMYMHMYINICLFVYMYICMYIDISYIFMYMYIYVCVYIYVYIYIYMYMCTYMTYTCTSLASRVPPAGTTHPYVYIHTHICIHIYIYIYICIYI